LTKAAELVVATACLLAEWMEQRLEWPRAGESEKSSDEMWVENLAARLEPRTVCQMVESMVDWKEVMKAGRMVESWADGSAQKKVD
jgi:hypothetical protein